VKAIQMTEQGAPDVCCAWWTCPTPFPVLVRYWSASRRRGQFLGRDASPRRRLSRSDPSRSSRVRR